MKFPSPFNADTNTINVIIETPKGCRAKYNYDEETELFKLCKILPEGMMFPTHFGFLPHTKGGDGDPLDVLVLLDEATYPGCLIECRILGVIEAEQIGSDGKKIRNDRIIATALLSKKYASVKSIKKLDSYLLDEITKFLITYNAAAGKKFKPVAFKGVAKTLQLIKQQQTEE